MKVIVRLKWWAEARRQGWGSHLSAFYCWSHPRGCWSATTASATPRDSIIGSRSTFYAMKSPKNRAWRNETGRWILRCCDSPVKRDGEQRRQRKADIELLITRKYLMVAENVATIRPVIGGAAQTAFAWLDCGAKGLHAPLHRVILAFREALLVHGLCQVCVGHQVGALEHVIGDVAEAHCVQPGSRLLDFYNQTDCLIFANKEIILLLIFRNVR